MELTDFQKIILTNLYYNCSNDGKFLSLHEVDPTDSAKGLRKLETDGLVEAGLIEYSNVWGELPLKVFITLKRTICNYNYYW